MNSLGEDPRALRGSTAHRRAIAAVFCAGMVVFAHLYAAQAILPDIAAEFDVPADTASWVIGAGTIGLAIGVLPWSMLSDRIGRAPALRIAVIAAVLVSLAVPFVPSFGALVALRVLAGLAIAGVPAIAVTYLSETLVPASFGAAVGTFIMGNTAGGLSGRIVVASVSDVFDWRVGLLAVSVLTAVIAMVFVWLVPPAKLDPKPVAVLRGVAVNLRNAGVVTSMAQGFLLMGSFVSVYNYLTFRLQEPPFGLTLAQTSWIYLTYLAGGLASRFVWRLVARSSFTRATIVSLASMLIGLALTFVLWLPVVILGLTLFTVGFFGAHSLASTLGPRSATEARSVVPPLYNLGAYTGSSLLGWLGGVAFVTAGWGGTAAMVAVAACLIALLALNFAKREGDASLK